MAPKRMDLLWSSYRTMVIPPDAPAVQITESKRAFYAGAHGLLSQLMLSLQGDAEPTEADLQMLTEIDTELQDFAQAVRNRRE